MTRPCIPDLSIMFKIYKVDEKKISDHAGEFSTAFLERATPALFKQDGCLYDIQVFVDQTKANLARFDQSNPTELEQRFVTPLRSAVNIVQDILDAMAYKRGHALDLWSTLLYLPVSIENVPERRSGAFTSSQIALKNTIDQLLEVAPDYWEAESIINAFRSHPIFVKPELQDFCRIMQSIIKPRLARAKKKTVK
jgi:hypothetical protein